MPDHVAPVVSPESASRRTRSILERKLLQLAAEESSLGVAVPEPGSQVQYGKRAGDHVAEAADRMARSRTAGELEKLEEEVRAALAKLAAGTYGSCEDCQGPVPAARLQALPWATRCVDCQSRLRR
ncbi:MAG TPA: TraR/DksA family transcriptional regulator [Candidatus Dormibacteraeota bacterium]|nr:TraR/DksA family transcriptional regulator [Candidatus Dormibacteraeota bacterium]